MTLFSWTLTARFQPVEPLQLSQHLRDTSGRDLRLPGQPLHPVPLVMEHQKRVHDLGALSREQGANGFREGLRGRLVHVDINSLCREKQTAAAVEVTYPL